jgi:hypothetical protein
MKTDEVMNFHAKRVIQRILRFNTGQLSCFEPDISFPHDGM